MRPIPPKGGLSASPARRIISATTVERYAMTGPVALRARFRDLKRAVLEDAAASRLRAKRRFDEMMIETVLKLFGIVLVLLAVAVVWLEIPAASGIVTQRSRTAETVGRAVRHMRYKISFVRLILGVPFTIASIDIRRARNWNGPCAPPSCGSAGCVSSTIGESVPTRSRWKQ